MSGLKGKQKGENVPYVGEKLMISIDFWNARKLKGWEKTFIL